MVFRFGRFFARSTIVTSVPISGPSTVMSEKMPAVWAIALVRVAMLGGGGYRVVVLMGEVCLLCREASGEHGRSVLSAARERVGINP